MVFFSLLAIVLSICVSPEAGYWSGILWTKLVCWSTPVRCNVQGLGHLDKSKSYVLVSNHQSYYDVALLVGFLPLNLKWVMKMELRKVPFFGYACEKVGHIFVDRSNRATALASMQDAREKIQKGQGVIFMPEGTRSATGELLKFKKGAFKFALDLGLPIVPITIVGAKDILPKGTLDLFPGCCSVMIHEPIDVTGYDDESLSPLVTAVKSRIQDGLDQVNRISR